MPIWHAVLLGVVQGLTEFLPVSSTAHLLVVRTWLGHPHIDDAFTVVVQMGTLAAVYGYFRRDILALLRGAWADLSARRLGSTPDGRLAWLIALGTVPGGVAGLLLKKWLKGTFYNLPAMGVVAIVFALLMWLAEWWGRRRAGRPVESVGVGDALVIGGWQALALMPGGSRSGCTITGGLFAGLSREAATRFSFLLSVPIITAAGLKELYDEWKKLKLPDPDGVPSLFDSGDQLVALGVGTVVAGVVGYLAIAGMLAFLRRYSTGVFVAYRLLFGAVLLLLAAR
jgi:undecaprenyl-diphosphatase